MLTYADVCCQAGAAEAEGPRRRSETETKDMLNVEMLGQALAAPPVRLA
jgi:hypothetical protein